MVWNIYAQIIISVVSAFLARSPKQRVEQGRLQSLEVQSSTFGEPVKIPYGRVRLAGNLIWMKDEMLEERRRQETKDRVKTRYYNYFGTGAIGICEGPARVIAVWADEFLYAYDASSRDAAGKLFFDISNLGANTNTIGGGSIGDYHAPLYNKTTDGNENWFYKGTGLQKVNDLIVADLAKRFEILDGRTKTPAWRGMAYHVFSEFPLEDFGNRIPSFRYEVLSSFSESTAKFPITQASPVASPEQQPPVQQSPILSPEPVVPIINVVYTGGGGGYQGSGGGSTPTTPPIGSPEPPVFSPIASPKQSPVLSPEPVMSPFFSPSVPPETPLEFEANQTGVGAFDILDYSVSFYGQVYGGDTPRGDTSTQASMAPGGSFIGEITKDFEAHWVGINLVSGTKYVVNVQSRGSGYTLLVPTIGLLRNDIIAAAGNYVLGIATDNIDVATGTTFAWVATYTGLHYIQVRASKGTDLGTYKINVATST